MSLLRLSGNRAWAGGAILYDMQTPANWTVTDCTIDNNTASNYGGGIGAVGFPGGQYAVNVLIQRTVFTGNVAGGSGGGGGGGMNLAVSPNTPLPQFTVDNCTFAANVATAGA